MLLRREHKNNNDAAAWCQRGRRRHIEINIYMGGIYKLNGERVALPPPRETQVRQAGLMGFGRATLALTHPRSSSIWTWTFLRCDFT